MEDIAQKFDLARPRKIAPFATSGNITYKIESNKGKFLLRLAPFGPRWRSKQEIAAELELIDRLLARNFPAPKPIFSKDGERIVSWKNHHGYLREFIKARAKLNPNEAEVKKFGEAVGRFHSLVENYKTKNKRKHIFDLAATRAYFKQKKARILKSNFRNKKGFVERLNREISALYFPENLARGMIHEDLGKRHILWQGNKIAGVIDFDRCYYGKLLLDLGEACRGWCFINNWTQWSNKNFQALLNGYQSKRKLTKLEKKYLLDAVKFGVLERSLAFALRYIEVTRDPEDEKFSRKSLFSLLDKLENNRRKIEKFLKRG